MKETWTNLSDRLGAAWSGLDARDRKTLCIAAPVIVLLILYLLVFQPVHARYQQAGAQQQELSDRLLWLYENAPLIERMQNGCARQRLTDRGDKNVLDFAQDIGRRSGTSPQIRAANNAGAATDLMVQINNASGNRALASLYSYACHGFVVSEVQLQRASETSTEVSLSFKLSASNYLQDG